MPKDFENAINTDQLDDDDVRDYENNVVVDEAARAEQSEAADIARLEDAAVDDELGERGETTSDTAEHLLPDTAGEQFGTHDMKKAIEQGQSYNPPEGPMQEGIEGGPQGERH
ncbi:MAG TPA: hypothetical protein VMM12_00590 [Longimicrobiales bacterium]|nr:hypothetical protein [Longimicrobiales bacterium]